MLENVKFPRHMAAGPRALARSAMGISTLGHGRWVGPLSITSDGWVIGSIPGHSGAFLGSMTNLVRILAAVIRSNPSMAADIRAAVKENVNSSNPNFSRFTDAN